MLKYKIPQIVTLTHVDPHQLYAIAVKTKNLRKKTCGGSL